jgi:hypothetical protein
VTIADFTMDTIISNTSNLMNYPTKKDYIQKEVLLEAIFANLKVGLK